MFNLYEKSIHILRSQFQCNFKKNFSQKKSKHKETREKK